jgi:C-terminal processing protease CtpA/Prc
VWGFLKYHHPSVTSGRLHWDYELFRIMPAILAANDREGANEVLKHWVDGLGPLGPTTPSEPITSDIFLPADTSWLGNRAVLGPALSERLRTIYAARPKVEASQFYVSRSQNAWNPEFTHELAYQRLRFPDAGYQLLALFRFWNIIRYWYPYRNLLDENWDAVLQEFIPRIGLAKDAGAFQLQLFALMTKVHDTHASLWSSTNLLPPVGDGQIPVVVRFVEGHPVVANLIQGESPGDLQRGDAIVAMDGVPVERLLAEWSPYYAASNEPTRLRDIARFMGRGPIGPAKLRIRRGNELLDVETLRAPVGSLPIPIEQTHDLPGPAFRLLSKDVAYLKLSAVKASAIPAYLEQAAGTKGWILDIRNYPSEFVVFALGSHFIDRPTKFARFTIANLADPGVFTLTKPVSLNPKLPQYAGKIVILVDEVSQSLSEYTAMAFRAAPEAIVIGSTTAGADGDVSSIPLPGGFLSRISGVGIFYPNMRPTQRIGILPDIEVKPTLAGIREGRDEVLEEALRQILGPEVPSEKIRKMSMESD